MRQTCFALKNRAAEGSAGGLSQGGREKEALKKVALRAADRKKFVTLPYSSGCRWLCCPDYPDKYSINKPQKLDNEKVSCSVFCSSHNYDRFRSNAGRGLDLSFRLCLLGRPAITRLLPLPLRLMPRAMNHCLDSCAKKIIHIALLMRWAMLMIVKCAQERHGHICQAWQENI